MVFVQPAPVPETRSRASADLPDDSLIVLTTVNAHSAGAGIMLPDAPTVAESGLPAYEAVSWFGLFGPPAMPAEVVAKVNAEVRRIFADPAVKKDFLERYYFESIADTPDALAAYIKAEQPKWRKVIEEAKLKVE